jgi:hypothetical protein
MTSDHIRASDYDRDAVVATLRDAFSEGRLTIEEFHDRTTAAYVGRTWGDLRELTHDLPVQPPLGGDLPPGAHPEFNPAPSRPGAQFPGAQQFPGTPQFPGAQPVAESQPATRLPPHVSQPTTDNLPPSARRRAGLGPVLPVVMMWTLFALATRSVGGAIIFLIFVGAVVMIALIARRRLTSNPLTLSPGSGIPIPNGPARPPAKGRAEAYAAQRAREWQVGDRGEVRRPRAPQRAPASEDRRGSGELAGSRRMRGPARRSRTGRQ